MALGCNPGLFKVAKQRLGHATRINILKANLDGRVAVVLFGTHLSNDVLANLHNRQGDNFSVLVPDLGHAELAAE